MIRRSAQASARRLQLRRIPLYQVHQPNPVVPDSVTMPGMRGLLDDDRIGASVELLVGPLAQSRCRARPAGDQ